MTLANKMTSVQERRFYREAVQASLQEFYGKSETEAKKLIGDWWKRLSGSKAFESGLFMHAEPINTAAGLADSKAVGITAKNREAYHRILEVSRDRVLVQVKGTQTNDEVKQARTIAA
jgi:hypothetical protein